jgi:hypothetical protein
MIVKLGGLEHKLAQVSVEDFIANTKAVEAFRNGVQGVEAEIELAIGMLKKAFPTMIDDMLRKLNILQLNKLVEFSQRNNGTKKVEEEAAAENPPKAG